MPRFPDHLLVPWVVDGVLRRPRIVVLGTLAMSVLAAWICTQAVIASSVGKLFFGESPKYLRYIESSEQIGSDIHILIGFEGLDPLSAETMVRMERAMARMEELSLDPATQPLNEVPSRTRDGADDFVDFGEFETSVGDGGQGLVRSVSGLPRAVDLRRIGDTLSARKYGEIVHEGRAEAGLSLKRLKFDPLVGGLLVSDDLKALAIIVELYPDKDRPAESMPIVISQLSDILDAEGLGGSHVHWAGMPSMFSEMIRLTHYNLQILLPVVTFLLVVTMFVLFKLLWPALLAACVSCIGVLWCMAFAISLDREISIMHSLAPLVIIIVSASDVIHLLSAYMQELRAGKPKIEAIRASASEVGRACLYTSLTTFMGFTALSFIPTPVFRQLGLVLGFGVAISLFLAVVLVPPILLWLPSPTVQAHGDGRVRRFIDGVLDRSCNLSLRHPRAIVIFFCLIGSLGAYGLTQFKVENEWAGRISPENQVMVDERWFGEHFTKGSVLQLVIDSGRPGGLLEKGVLAQLAKLEAQIEGDPRVDKVFSLIDPLTRLDREFRGGSGSVPDSRGTISEYMLSLETMSRSALEGLVDFERQRALLSIRMESDRVRAMAEFGDEMANKISKELGKDFTVEPTGMLYMVGDWLTEILAGQRRGLGFSFTAIAIMMVIGLGSLTTGLWSMVPNLLPLFMLGGVLGLMYDQVDSDILVLAMLAIGIGVDDTIHFLMRLRLETEAGHGIEDAIRRTYASAGRGILITTLVLAIGFAPFSSSDYWSILILGSFLPLTLVFALLADLFLVPAMGVLGLIRFEGASAISKGR